MRTVPRFEAERGRIARFQAGMERDGLDAVVISNPKTFRYFTGQLPLLTLSPTRPWHLVIPQSGDPIACVPAIGEADIRAESWIADVRVWPSPNPEEEGVSALIAALHGLARRHRRIGLELGREMRPNMPAGDLDRVRAAIADVRWVDASTLIWSLRLVKDADEIAAMRRAIAAAMKGFASITAELKPGMSEREAARLLMQSVIAVGADAVPYLACSSGPGGYPSLTRAAGDRRLAEGDVIGFDVGATVDGYFCDFNRNFTIGAAPEASTRALDTLQQAIAAALPLCQAGMPIVRLRKAMQQVVADAGFSPSDAGRWGHGVGLDFTEPPSLMRNDPAILQAGMVITLEPTLTLNSGHDAMLVAEEMVLVDAGTPTLLTAQK